MWTKYPLWLFCWHHVFHYVIRIFLDFVQNRNLNLASGTRSRNIFMLIHEWILERKNSWITEFWWNDTWTRTLEVFYRGDDLRMYHRVSNLARGLLQNITVCWSDSFNVKDLLSTFSDLRTTQILLEHVTLLYILILYVRRVSQIDTRCIKIFRNFHEYLWSKSTLKRNDEIARRSKLDKNLARV